MFLLLSPPPLSFISMHAGSCFGGGYSDGDDGSSVRFRVQAIDVSEKSFTSAAAESNSKSWLTKLGE